MPTCEELGVLLSEEDKCLMWRKWTVSPLGYARTNWTVNGRRVNVQMHRLVVARMAGRDLTPEDICDHMNGNKLDNRRENLRIVSRSINSQNKRAYSNTGELGISRFMRGNRVVFGWNVSAFGTKRQGQCRNIETAIQKRNAAMIELGHGGVVRIQ